MSREEANRLSSLRREELRKNEELERNKILKIRNMLKVSFLFFNFTFFCLVWGDLKPIIACISFIQSKTNLPCISPLCVWFSE